MLKPKIGDTVRLKPMVVMKMMAGDGHALLEIPDEGPRWFDTNAIEEVVPRPLAVGDRVATGPCKGIVLAIHDAWAWLAIDGRGYATVETIRLTRLDAA